VSSNRLNSPHVHPEPRLPQHSVQLLRGHVELPEDAGVH
jgi:hypothetical protein